LKLRDATLAEHREHILQKRAAKKSSVEPVPPIVPAPSAPATAPVIAPRTDSAPPPLGVTPWTPDKGVPPAQPIEPLGGAETQPKPIFRLNLNI
jgi:hypothetical protein